MRVCPTWIPRPRLGRDRVAALHVCASYTGLRPMSSDDRTYQMESPPDYAALPSQRVAQTIARLPAHRRHRQSQPHRCCVDTHVPTDGSFTLTTGGRLRCSRGRSGVCPDSRKTTTMSKNYRTAIAIAGLLAISAQPSRAHHSNAPHYDASKPVTLEGVVTQVRFVNPPCVRLRGCHG